MFTANETRNAYRAKNQIESSLRDEFRAKYGIENIVSSPVASRQLELAEAFQGNVIYVANPENLSNLDEFSFRIQGKYAARVHYAGEDDISEAARDGKIVREIHTKVKTKDFGKVGKFIFGIIS